MSQHGSRLTHLGGAPPAWSRVDRLRLPRLARYEFRSSAQLRGRDDGPTSVMLGN